MYTFIHMYANRYIFACIDMNTDVCINQYRYTYMCVNINAYIYVQECICKNTYICIYVCVYIHLYV